MRAMPLTEKQRKAMMPYQQHVGKIYRTLDWLRDSILNENGEEFRRALDDLRNQLSKLDALISPTLGSEPTLSSRSDRPSVNSEPLSLAGDEQVKSEEHTGLREEGPSTTKTPRCSEGGASLRKGKHHDGEADKPG
jgi:hypothetical protein